MGQGRVILKVQFLLILFFSFYVNFIMYLIYNENIKQYIYIANFVLVIVLRALNILAHLMFRIAL